MKFVLTSTGLSILTNYLKNFKIFPNEVYKYANQKDIEVEFLEKIDPHIEKLKHKIVDYSSDDLKKISAELNALLTFYKNKFDKEDIHYILHTDTYLGKATAEIIKAFLKSKGLNASLFNARDLNTSNVEDFQFALSEVVKDLSPILSNYQESGYEIIFNLTGGFKGVNSFLQTMASLYADRSIYIFESGDELLEIPRMPIKIDEEFFKDNFDILRKIEKDINVNVSLPSSIVIKIAQEYTLSPWGEIVWQKYKIDYFKNNLLKPITNKIKYSKELEKDFEKLSSNEKYQFNKSIEKLEDFILHGDNLKSLRYHTLSGNISQKYNAEFYPFDGNDSRRAYCNEDNGVITVEKIDRHLK
jgi:putative CRISPR-associated protein (TIGR02619 family)